VASYRISFVFYKKDKQKNANVAGSRPGRRPFYCRLKIVDCGIQEIGREVAFPLFDVVFNPQSSIYNPQYQIPGGLR
jgi:hypothetical protein